MILHLNQKRWKILKMRESKVQRKKAVKGGAEYSGDKAKM
jgi:hypothetical protein